MLWADTREIGCATSFYTTQSGGDKWHHLILVCNYGPGGNYLGFPVYQIGEPGSNCPTGTKRNKRFKGLCGVEESVKKVRKEFEGSELELSLNNLFS